MTAPTVFYNRTRELEKWSVPVGSVGKGVMYANNGILIELRLDEPTLPEKQTAITEAVRRIDSPLDYDLLPMAFVPWTNGTVIATVVFSDHLNDEDLERAVILLLERLVELGCMNTMPDLPSPLCVRR